MSSYANLPSGSQALFEPDYLGPIPVHCHYCNCEDLRQHMVPIEVYRSMRIHGEPLMETVHICVECDEKRDDAE